MEQNLPPRPWTLKANGSRSQGYSIYDANGTTFLYFPYVNCKQEEIMEAIVKLVNEKDEVVPQ